MGVGVLFLLVLAACALPEMMPRTLGIASHPPDLWIATTAYLALRGRAFSAVGWAILLGLVRDALSLDPLGTHAFTLGAVAFLFAEGAGHRGRIDGGTRLLWTFAVALAAGWTYLLRILPLGGGIPPASAFLGVVPTALWTTVLGAVLFPLLDRTRALDDLCGRARGLPA
jgi:rod shape-determining protein MreD